MEKVKMDSGSNSNCRAYITIAVLCLVNLLNFMDRYTVAAVLIPIQNYFGINDSQGGLLQTVFICSFLIFAPLFGYLGDRFSRKLIMIIGIFIWSSAVLLSSFVQPQHFWMFFVARGIVGIGEASYCTVAPTIIADLFTKDKRSRMLMLYYLAIPFGSGLGYIIGSGVAQLLGAWQWGVRVTPAFGIICWLLLIFLLKEPKRGAADAAQQLKSSTFLADLRYLAKNKTFIWVTSGFTCINFSLGAVALWAPSFAIYSQSMQLKPVDQISIMFGFVTGLAGFLGVVFGSLAATRWRRTNNLADPLICGLGLLIALPFYYTAINIIAINLPVTWVLMFLTVIFLYLNSAVTTDMMMYVVIPNKRSTANAVQMCFGHFLGDASSPYIIGAISDAIRGSQDSDFEHYLSLKYALFVPPFFLVLGGFFYLGSAWFVENDKKRAQIMMKKMDAIKKDLDKVIEPEKLFYTLASLQ